MVTWLKDFRDSQPQTWQLQFVSERKSLRHLILQTDKKSLDILKPWKQDKSELYLSGRFGADVQATFLVCLLHCKVDS